MDKLKKIKKYLGKKFKKGEFKLKTTTSTFKNYMKEYYSSGDKKHPELLDWVLKLKIFKDIKELEYSNNDELSKKIVSLVFTWYTMVNLNQAEKIVPNYIEEKMKIYEKLYDESLKHADWEEKRKKAKKEEKDLAKKEEIQEEINKAREYIEDSKFQIEMYIKLELFLDIWNSLIEPYKEVLQEIKDIEFVDPLEDLKEKAEEAKLATRLAESRVVVGTPQKKHGRVKTLERGSVYRAPRQSFKPSETSGFDKSFLDKLEGLIGAGEKSSKEKIKKLVEKRAATLVVKTMSMPEDSGIPLNYGPEGTEFHKYTKLLKLRMPPGAVYQKFMKENQGKKPPKYDPLPMFSEGEETPEEKKYREDREREEDEYRRIRENLQKRQEEILKSKPDGVSTEVMSSMADELAKELTRRFGDSTKSSFGRRYSKRRTRKRTRKRTRRRSKSTKRKSRGKRKLRRRKSKRKSRKRKSIKKRKF